ncbi:unnamed protein product [Closterium sp. NIES-65]|nr:unnamed protein product [Closterium sp. NIES-65]
MARATKFVKPIVLSVFMSNRYIYAQVVHEPTAFTLAAASSIEAAMRKSLTSTSDKIAATEVGKALAARMLEKQIGAVAFELGPTQMYHGKLRSLLDALTGSGMSTRIGGKDALLKGVGAGAAGKGAVEKGAAGKGATGKGAAGKGGAGATAAGKGAANKGAAGKGAPGKVAEGKGAPSKAAEGKSATDASAADKGAAKKGAAGKSATNAQHAASPQMAAPPHMATAEDVAIHTVKTASNNHPAGSNAQRAARPHMATAEDVAIVHPGSEKATAEGATVAPMRAAEVEARPHMAAAEDVTIIHPGSVQAMAMTAPMGAKEGAARPHMATAEDVAIIHPGSAKATAAAVAPMQAEEGEAWRNVAADDDNDDGNDRENDNDGDKENDNDRDGDQDGDNEKDNDNDAVQWHGGEGSSTRMNGGSKGQRRGRTHGSDKGASSLLSRFSNSRGWEPRGNQRTGLDKAQQFRMATSSDVAIREGGIQGASRGVHYGSNNGNNGWELEDNQRNGFHKAQQFRMATSSDVAIHRSGVQGADLGVKRRSWLDMAPGFLMATARDVAIPTSGVQGADRGVNYGNEQLGAQAEGGDCDGNNGGGIDNGGGGGQIDIGAILEVHNAARREVGVPDLAWDDGVAAAAQEWADQLAGAGCPLQHGGAEGLGQNLYWRAPAALTPEEDRMAVQAWVDEKADWSYSAVPEGCAEGKVCGHYTQVVWAWTTHVGCASVQCPDGGGMWVCDYSPQGNIIGYTPF